MKKLVMLLLAMLLCLGMDVLAEECLHPAESVEYIMLDEDTHQMTCSACGLTQTAEHNNGTQHSDNLHWYGCALCNYVADGGSKELHYAGCWAPDTCLLCGAEGIIPGYALEHGDLDAESYTKWDDEYHYCPYCDLPEKHEVYCNNPGYCWICGANDLNRRPEHDKVDALYADLGSQHQWTCGCGETFVEDHANYCGEAACDFCGHWFTEEEKLDRQHALYAEADVYSHRLYCHCGYSVESEPHTFYCDNLLCINCYVPRATDDTVCTLLHREESYISVSAEQHKLTCAACGEETLGDHTFDAEDVCSLCGQVNAVKPVRIPGDANDDGMVNILDALVVLEYDVGWGNVINNANADVDGDGIVTILDALRILQYDVGWDVELL